MLTNPLQYKKIEQKANSDVQFTDMLEVHNIRHNLCMARASLVKNVEVLTAMAKDNDHIAGACGGSSATSLTNMAGQFERELGSALTRTDNILRRLDGAASLV